MKQRIWNRVLPVLLMLAGPACGAQTRMDPATADKVDRIIRTDVLPFAGEDRAETLSRVSAAFLGTRYQANTLVGSASSPEALVVNFNAVDCFTFADYVEALSQSRDRQSFLQNLTKIRYINGQIDYRSRRHFFTDWSAVAPRNALDITPTLSPRSRAVRKQLNARPGGGEFVPGIGVRPRVVNYIPGSAVDDRLIDKLKNGDYVGIYSPLRGLDVSHVGMVVRHGGRVWFRDASSAFSLRKVVDSPFLAYVRATPGIVVLRSTH